MVLQEVLTAHSVMFVWNIICSTVSVLLGLTLLYGVSDYAGERKLQFPRNVWSPIIGFIFFTNIMWITCLVAASTPDRCQEVLRFSAMAFCLSLFSMYLFLMAKAHIAKLSPVVTVLEKLALLGIAAVPLIALVVGIFSYGIVKNNDEVTRCAFRSNFYLYIVVAMMDSGLSFLLVFIFVRPLYRIAKETKGRALTMIEDAIRRNGIAATVAILSTNACMYGMLYCQVHVDDRILNIYLQKLLPSFALGLDLACVIYSVAPAFKVLFKTKQRGSTVQDGQSAGASVANKA